jgi:class 3 adenylate cyclase
VFGNTRTGSRQVPGNVSDDAPRTGARDAGFPLRRNFLLFIFPLLMLALVGFTVSVGYVLSNNLETFFLTREASRAQSTINFVARLEPDLWSQVIAPEDAGRASEQRAGGKLQDLLARELSELGLSCMALYDASGHRRLNVRSTTVCPEIDKSLVDESLGEGDPTLREDLAEDGSWTVLAPIKVPPRELAMLAVTNQPARRYEVLILRQSGLWVAVFGAVFLVGIGFAYTLVSGAQRQIDRRTDAVVLLRRQLERFVSRHTVAAVHGAGNQKIAPRRIECTVLFADIRDFSSFAEAQPPELVVALVDRIMNTGVRVVGAEGGDVDKMIGDGMLAWFEGTDRRERALAAAVHFIDDTERMGLPRGIGIGLHDGEVVAAPVGGETRLDFTILGRAVNQASRLCSAARRGQIVASITSLQQDDAGLPHSRHDEEMMLKGHQTPMIVRRITPSGGPPLPPHSAAE